MREPQIGDIYRLKTRKRRHLWWVVDDIDYVTTPFRIGSGIVVTLDQGGEGNGFIQLPVEQLERDFLLDHSYLQADHMEWYGGQSS